MTKDPAGGNVTPYEVTNEQAKSDVDKVMLEHIFQLRITKDLHGRIARTANRLALRSADVARIALAEYCDRYP